MALTVANESVNRSEGTIQLSYLSYAEMPRTTIELPT